MTFKEIREAITHENEMVAQNFVVKFDAFYRIDNKSYYIYGQEFFTGKGERTEVLRTRSVLEFLEKMEEIAPFAEWTRSPGWGEEVA